MQILCRCMCAAPVVERREQWSGESGWTDGWGVRYGWIGGQREKVRGVYGFSSLVKQNKKLKIALSFASPEKEKYYFICYAVIVKQFFYKRSTNHYLMGG